MKKVFIIIVITLSANLVAFAQIPTDNLKGWYIADSAILSSGYVTQLLDYSGNNNHITQGTLANMPLKVDSSINNHASIKFDAINDFMNFTTSILPTDGKFSYFFVCKNTKTGLNSTLFSQYSAGQAGRTLIVFNFQATNRCTHVTLPDGSALFNFSSSEFFILSCTNNGATSGLKLFENGLQKVQGTATAIQSINSQLGGQQFANYFGGEIAEILVYNSPLDELSQDSVELYLMDKYSATLDLGADINVEDRFCDTALIINQIFNDLLWSTGETNDTIYVNQTGQYWVQATDIFGRVRYDTISVQFPNPNIQNTSICLGDSVLYEPELVGSYDYLWSDAGTEPSKYYKDAGDYWLRIEDSFGCFDTVFFTVAVDSFKNNISLGNDTSLCSGNSISLIGGEELCSSFLWPTNGNSSPTQTVNESGWQKIEVENANGCAASDSIYVTIVGAAPTPGYIVENLCFGETTQFIDNSTPQADIASWKWIINGNDTLFTQNAEWVFENVGTQNIQLIVEAFSGCENSISFEIEILPSPIVTFTNIPGCTGIELQFIPEYSIPNDTELISFNWFVDNVLQSNSEIFAFTFPTNNNYNILCLVELDNGCYGSFNKDITVLNSYDQPSAVSLISPTNNIISSTTHIDFMWNNSSDATFYKIQLALENTFSELLFESENIYSLNYNYAFSGIYDTIYWRVLSFNPCAESSSSEVFLLSLFTPESLPKLKTWLSADFGVNASANSVEQWVDRSSNGNDLLQNIATNKPVIVDYSINGLPTIKFDGINDFMDFQTNILPLDAVFSYFFVCKNTQTTNNSTIFSQYIAGQNGRTLLAFNFQNQGNLTHFINPGTNAAQSILTTNFSQISATNNGLSNGLKLYVNNLPAAVGSATAILNTNSQIGGQQFSSYFKGDIAEIIFYDTVLSDSDRQMVERYLHDKYFPPVNLGYDIRIPYGFCDTAITTAYKPWFTDYEWSTGETDSIIHVNRPGVYSVTVTDIFGFESSDDIRVFYPDVNDFADTVVCFGNSVVWDAELMGDYSFAWYGSSETTRAITIDAEGDYAVIVNDTLGCQYLSDTISFSFDNYEFTASVGPADTALCNGNRLMLVTNRPETVSYLWSTGSTTPEIVLSTSGTYTVTTTNWRGCEAIDAIDVTITGTVPVPLFSSEGHCAQNPVYFTDLSTSSDGTINSWTWSINGNIFSTEQNPVLSPGDIPTRATLSPESPAGETTTNLLRKHNDTARLYRVVPTVNGRETESSGNIPSQTKANQTKSPTNYQVQLTISTDAGCSDFLTSPLTIYPLPAVSFSPNYFCQYAPVEFSSTAQVDGGTISENIWDFNGTLQSGTNINHTFTQSGNNPITLTSTSDVGCIDSLVTEVYVKNASLPVFSTENACEGSEIYFINNTEVLAHNLPLEWNWDFGDGNTGSGSDPAHIYENAGIYDVAVNVVWENRCEVPATAQVEVYSNPSLSLLAEDECINIPFSIEKTVESLSGEVVNYNWTFGSENPQISANENPEFNLSQPGEYPVNLNIETEYGCVANAVDTVIVHGNPHALFTPSRVWGAVPMEVVFTNNSEGASTYLWSFGDSGTSSDEEPVYIFNGEGEFDVVLQSYSQFGCVDDTTIRIKTVIPILDVILYDLRPVMSGNYLQTKVYVINNGTLPVNNAEITLDLGDGKIFRENIEYLAPSQVLDYKFNMEVYRADGKVPEVVCTEIYAPPFEGYAETTVDDNVLCSTDVETLRVYQPYPNPATGELNLSFILESESDVTITLINGIGEQVYKYSMSNKTGYQKHIINVSNFTPGVYYLQVVAGDEVRSFKVEVM
jgi:hypothetical protein